MDRHDAERVESPIHVYLRDLHARYAGLRNGEVASYIPELSKANPDWFGISIATTDGHLYEVGDTRQPFTIQSISKPFTYGLAIEDVGLNAVLQKIGVEPTGDAFNSISLEPRTGRPLNPMINAGAITATSLVAGHSTADRLYRLLAVMSLYAGRGLSIDEVIYESERETGHRNRAIGHMLRNFDILTEDPDPALTLYFQQCSIAVDCRDLSVMAATLANGGINPFSGERAVRSELVPNILSVMTTCGMYDYAGEWVYWVGMPAKSGVAGGVLAVLPGQLGIGVFSPPLDPRGNSVRGVQVCKDLSREFNLHFLRVARSAHAAIRADYSAAEVSSKRLRTLPERKLLDAAGQRIRVYDLQGDIGFPALETLVRRLVEASEELEFAIIDLKRVNHFDDSSTPVLSALLHSFARRDKHLVFAGTAAHARLVRQLGERLSALTDAPTVNAFEDLDHALEWCENRLLSHSASGALAVSLADHDLCRGLDAGAVGRLEALLEPQRFERGTLIARKGETADRLYLLMRGEVSVTIDLPDGRLKRLSTLSAGMTFGELAVVGHTVRTADVRADTAVECYTLTTATFDRLGTTDPPIKLKLLENLLRNAAWMVGRLNQEVGALSR